MLLVCVKSSLPPILAPDYHAARRSLSHNEMTIARPGGITGDACLRPVSRTVAEGTKMNTKAPAFTLFRLALRMNPA
jgi:hypothetical protein